MEKILKRLEEVINFSEIQKMFEDNIEEVICSGEDSLYFDFSLGGGYNPDELTIEDLKECIASDTKDSESIYYEIVNVLKKELPNEKIGIKIQKEIKNKMYSHCYNMINESRLEQHIKGIRDYVNKNFPNMFLNE